MDHRELDDRSLFLAHQIAARLRQRPELWAHPRANIERWGDSPAKDIRFSREMMTRPAEEILAAYTEDSEEGRRIRQSAPFAGVLSPKERIALFKRFRDDPSAA